MNTVCRFLKKVMIAGFFSCGNFWQSLIRSAWRTTNFRGASSFTEHLLAGDFLDFLLEDPDVDVFLLLLAMGILELDLLVLDVFDDF